MNEVRERSLLVHQNGYCSLAREIQAPVEFIEEGVTRFKKILERSLLCQHDVESLNFLYEGVDRLERKAQPLPTENSLTALNALADKINKVEIPKEKNAENSQTLTSKSENLISLFHLKKFKVKKMGLEGRFKRQMTRLGDFSSKFKQAIAQQLPCCHSLEAFLKEVEALLPGTQIDEVGVLKKKKNNLLDYDDRKKEAEKRRNQLKIDRQREPLKYPSYLDEVLNHGFIKLYDHLLEMNNTFGGERKVKINKLRFSDACLIALEIREAVIARVSRAISKNFKDIWFLLGRTKAGKTTTLFHLRGYEMVLNEENNYCSESDKEGHVGHLKEESCTFLPLIEIVDGSFFVDYAGFEDTHGSLVCLGQELALMALVNQYKPKIMIVQDFNEEATGYQAAKDLGEYLSDHFDDRSKCVLALTKFNKNAAFKDLLQIEKDQRSEMVRPIQIRKGVLEGIIKTCTRLGVIETDSEFANARRELKQIEGEEEQIEKSSSELPENDRKKSFRLSIEEQETNIKRFTGITRPNSCVRLDILNLANRAKLLKALKDQEGAAVSVNPSYVLKGKPKELLDDLFDQDLLSFDQVKKDLQSDFENDSGNVRQSIIETSLVSAVLQNVHPEVGQLLHLAEVGPIISSDYDKKILEKWWNYMIEVLSGILLSPQLHVMQRFLKDDKNFDENKKTGFNEAYEAALVRLEFFTGVKLKDLKEDKLKEKVEEIRKSVNARIDEAIEKIELTGYLRWLQWLPYFGIISKRWLITDQELEDAQKNGPKKDLEEQIGRTTETFKKIERYCAALVDIRCVINQEESVRKSFQDDLVIQPRNLKASIGDWIEKFKAPYGQPMWDQRVRYILETCDLVSLCQKHDLFSQNEDFLCLYLLAIPGATMIIERVDNGGLLIFGRNMLYPKKEGSYVGEVSRFVIDLPKFERFQTTRHDFAKALESCYVNIFDNFNLKAIVEENESEDNKNIRVIKSSAKRSWTPLHIVSAFLKAAESLRPIAPQGVDV